MQKGFTLLEILIALLIISVLLTLSLPAWQQHRQQNILQKEQQKLYIFLRQIQARVENSSDIWFFNCQSPSNDATLVPHCAN